MVDIFKNWVSVMLCFGIFITFLQLIIPKTNLKKYIYSLVGIITIITVISPVIKIIKNKSIEESVQEVIANISSDSTYDAENLDKYKNANEDIVRSGFIDGMKSDITTKLLEKGIEVKSVDIFLTEQYNIEKFEVTINKIDILNSSISDVNSVVKYINQEYELDFSKIVVIEEGTE